MISLLLYAAFVDQIQQLPIPGVGAAGIMFSAQGGTINLPEPASRFSDNHDDCRDMVVDRIICAL